MGKTATILNMILNSVIRSDDTHSTFFSCEMSLKSVMNRIFGQVGQIKLGRLRNPNAAFTKDDWERHTHVKEILKSLKGRIEVTNEYKISDIRARIRKIIRDNPNKKHVFYIDHIDHVKVEGNFSSKVQEVGEIAHKFKKIATEFNVPIVLLSQLNRGVEQRPNKRAGMSDLRESGTIEQVADTIITLYREQYYNPDCDERDKGILEMIFVKHRDGMLGTLKFKFSPELGTITEVLER
jgi:replicative DNA helicase